MSNETCFFCGRIEDIKYFIDGNNGLTLYICQICFDSRPITVEDLIGFFKVFDLEVGEFESELELTE